VLAIAGVYLATSIPISVFPQTNFPRVLISIDNGVMPVDQMQVMITRPIELAVQKVPGLELIRSDTSRGSAGVSLFFNWNVDMDQTLQRVEAAVAQVQQSLPTTAQISTQKLTFATFPILGYSLTSNTLSQTALWEMATYDLKPPLNQLNGVRQVLVQGGQVPEVEIVPGPAKMLAAGVTVTDLLNAVHTGNVIHSPGLYEANHQLVLGLVGGQVHDAAGLAQIVVKTTAAEVAQLKKTLPAGVELEPFYDQSQLVRESISSVRDAIISGLILASVILV